MDEFDYFKAMQIGIPPIQPKFVQRDPVDEIEANEGICAQESER